MKKFPPPTPMIRQFRFAAIKNEFKEWDFLIERLIEMTVTKSSNFKSYILNHNNGGLTVCTKPWVVLIHFWQDGMSIMSSPNMWKHSLKSHMHHFEPKLRIPFGNCWVKQYAVCFWNKWFNYQIGKLLKVHIFISKSLPWAENLNFLPLYSKQLTAPVAS